MDAYADLELSLRHLEANAFWDIEIRQSFGELIGKNEFHEIFLASGKAFSPDGNLLAAIKSCGEDSTVILFDLNPDSWIKATCQRVGRNFTCFEWEQYFTGEPYRATCPQWPIEPEPTIAPTP